MKKHSRGYRWGGLFGGAVYEAKPGLILLGLKHGMKGLENEVRKYIHRNFRIFKNTLLTFDLRRLNIGSMVDMMDLHENEVVIIDTTANIVSVISLVNGLEVRDENDNVLTFLTWGETFTLGYNRGKFKLRANSGGRIYIVRQFIL